MTVSPPCSRGRGLRQGENLSPILFSLFLNELENYLIVKESECISLFDADLDLYLKLYVLLYADDTVIFAKSENDLISTLSLFVDYCKIGNLNINVEKTKIMVFGDSIRQSRNIVVQNIHFEVVNTFKYLGVIFSENRRFLVAKQHSVNQARKALFSLYTKIRNLYLPFDCQLKRWFRFYCMLVRSGDMETFILLKRSILIL